MRRLPILLACVVMALTLVAIAVATGASAAPKKLPPNHFYGALDYSKSNQVVYWAHAATKSGVNRAAYNHCHVDGHTTDCRTVVWVYNGWVAAAKSSKYWGFGWARTKQQAWNKAVTNCQSAQGAPRCKVIGSSQTARDPNKKTKGGYSLPGP